MFRLIKRAPWIALGAVVAYYADPSSGITRRRRLRRRIEELIRTGDGDARRSGLTAADVSDETIERRRSEDTVEPIPKPDTLN